MQLRFTDRLLGELLRRLRTIGLYDQALLVVAADHGVSFRPDGPRRNVTPANVGEIGGVPLFVKAPGKGRAGSTLRRPGRSTSCRRSVTISVPAGTRRGAR